MSEPTPDPDAAPPPPSRPSRRRRRGLSTRARAVLIIVVAALVIFLFSLRGLAQVYTDFLWFDSLGYESVWEEIVLTKLLLGATFAVAMFLLLWVNLAIADRIAPVFRPAGPEEEFVRRYHELIGGRARLVRLGVAGLFGLLWGATASGQWRNWTLFRNRVDFGVDDPQFDTDIGFYVFTLPFIRFLIGWLFTAFVIVSVVTVTAHYLNGGIRVNASRRRALPQVKAHLSVLLAVLAAIKAVDYWYQRYSLTLSRRGSVDGASFTEVKAHLPAINLLILISVCAVLLLLANIWRRGWVLPAVAVGLWTFVAVVMGGIFPAVYQRFFVEPSESSKELPYIARNIAATREAYGMVGADAGGEPVDGTVSTIGIPGRTGELSGEIIAANEESVSNVRLLDPDVVQSTFQRLQADRDEYQFTDIDVDRYVIDGESQPVVIGARQLSDRIPGGKWENRHVGFTHGFGVSLAPANQVNAQGRPEFVVGELPTVINDERFEGTLAQPRVYIGEDFAGYAIVNTGREEVDYPLENTNVTFVYDGEDGVEMGGLVRRLAFAVRFADVNPVFSSFIDEESRIIFRRDVRERASELAPFLEYDADTYPVIVDGRLVWVLDAYTTTDAYPYSQHASTTALPGGSGLRSDFNYVRNSVKVTVDAYDGGVTFYVVDDTDPLIRAWQQAFPDLFTPGSEIPSELSHHLRYPSDLFTVQTNLWGRYHIGDAGDFFDPAQEWTIALDPGRFLRSAAESETAPTPTPTSTSLAEVRASLSPMQPQYVQMVLPGEEEAEFVTFRAFVPAGGADDRQELTAFMVARSDPEHYGELVVFQVPGTSVDGPFNANARMLSNRTVAQRTTLLAGSGSQVELGDILLLPLGGDLLWVRPLYVSGSRALPELNSVMVAYGEEVRSCPTLSLALAALFVDESLLENDDQCSAVQTGEGEGPEPDAPGEEEPDEADSGEPEDVATQVARLLAEAERHFAAAEAALAAGDLGEYQELTELARTKVTRAATLLEGLTPAAAGTGSGTDPDATATPTATPTTGATASPTATPTAGATAGPTSTPTAGATATTTPEASEEPTTGDA